MKPEYGEIMEQAKNYLPFIGMMTRSTDDKSLSKIKVFIERSFVGIFISAVWIVASTQVASIEREAQNKLISDQAILIKESHREIRLILENQSAKMDQFDAKFSEKHLTLSNRVGGLEVDVRVVQAMNGIIKRQ